MTYMSKTKRKRVMRQRALGAAIAVCIAAGVLVLIWQLGLGSTLATVNGVSIRSGNVKGVASFSEYSMASQYGITASFLSDAVAEADDSAKTEAEDNLLVYRNSILENVLIPLETLKQHFASQDRVFPNEEELAQIDEVTESIFSSSETSKTLESHGVKKSHVRMYLEYEAAITAYQAEVVEQDPITDEEAQTYYDDNKAAFVAEPLSMQASHILIKDEAHTAEKRAEIEAVLEQIKAGGDFAELAKEYSEDTSAESGGDLGSFGEGAMVAPFEQACLALEPGEVSDIVETEYGYHIIKLTSKTEASYQPIEDVRETIDSYIGYDRMIEAQGKLVEEADIEYTGLVNKTTGKPPVTIAELTEARGLAGSADTGSGDIGSADTGSADISASADSGSAQDTGASDDTGSADNGSGDAAEDGASADSGSAFINESGGQ